MRGSAARLVHEQVRPRAVQDARERHQVLAARHLLHQLVGAVPAGVSAARKRPLTLANPSLLTPVRRVRPRVRGLP